MSHFVNELFRDQFASVVQHGDIAELLLWRLDSASDTNERRVSARAAGQEGTHLCARMEPVPRRIHRRLWKYAQVMLCHARFSIT